LNLTINDKLRAETVDRFQLVRTHRKQSIAEHMWAVATLANEVCNIACMDPQPLIKAAIFHDIAEVVTGDIPTPTKEMARNAGLDLNSLVDCTPIVLLTGTQKLILKACDLIDAMRFLAVEGYGEHAKVVLSSIRTKVFRLVEFECDDGDVRKALMNVINAIQKGN